MDSSHVVACPHCGAQIPAEGLGPGRYVAGCAACGSSIEFILPAGEGQVRTRRLASFQRLVRFKRLAAFREVYHDHHHVGEFVWESNWQLLAIYLGLVGVAELLTVLVSPVAGLVVHCVVLAAFLGHAGAVVNHSVPMARIAFVMAIIPIMRIVSLTTAVATFGYFPWFLFIGAVMAATVVTYMRELEYSLEEVGLAKPALRWIPLDVAIIAAGVGIGVLEYLLLKPGSVFSSASWVGLIGPSLLFVLFTGILEEAIFRGLLPAVLGRVYGGLGAILIPALVQGALDLGSLNVLHIALVVATGILYGLVARRTRSIWGVGISHGVTNVVLFLVLPRIWG